MSELVHVQMSCSGTRVFLSSHKRAHACMCLLLPHSRLYPLTQRRTLPAVPFASNYRLIDIVLSNLVNSNIRRVCVTARCALLLASDGWCWARPIVGWAALLV